MTIDELCAAYPALMMAVLRCDWFGRDAADSDDLLVMLVNHQPSGHTLAEAEAEAAAITGADLARIAAMDPGEEDPVAPILCRVLTAIFE